MNLFFSFSFFRPVAVWTKQMQLKCVLVVKKKVKNYVFVCSSV